MVRRVQTQGKHVLLTTSHRTKIRMRMINQQVPSSFGGHTKLLRQGGLRFCSNRRRPVDHGPAKNSATTQAVIPGRWLPTATGGEILLYWGTGARPTRTTPMSVLVFRTLKVEGEVGFGRGGTYSGPVSSGEHRIEAQGEIYLRWSTGTALGWLGHQPDTRSRLPCLLR